jgi:four helix bundle protein
MGREQPTAKSFCDLIVWRKSHDFVLGVYRLTSAFPKQENYGLALQFRRAAVSIPANIAEGFKRYSRKEKVRFLNIAEGSIAECRCYLMLARDLGYGSTEELMGLLEEVSRMLTSYVRAIRTSEF